MSARLFLLSSIVLASFAFAVASVSAAKHELLGQAVPELSQQHQRDWLNSKPLTFAALRGNVVLLDFWTFDCWNCYKSFPWLNSLQVKYADKPFKIVGVHSPEFAHEKDREKVAAKIAEFNLQHPVMIDNDFIFWRALHNRYWPSFYIIDKQGVLRGYYLGETHRGDSQARRISSLIGRLLGE